MIEDEGRQRGLSIRADTIQAITRTLPPLIASLSQEGFALSARDVLSEASVAHIAADLAADRHWAPEYWAFGDLEEVAPVSLSEFSVVEPKRRFSMNECLRRPAKDAWALRGFLSALTSPDAQEALSAAWGAPVEFRSADIARYNRGDYLRRHSDIFDGRRFGIVWFMSTGWTQELGGELIAEGAGGESVVIYPTSGAVGLLSFKENCFHQVAQIRSSAWTRYSIASHYAARSAR